ncbi:hypothetical protein MLD38_021779 [Melastoma candidum]|uniref:Uncharacterized protein n=1 Tax=Melastoma candidum TaxID=119954 RepID=A0ACB9QHN2_9MYRT|nr:hypothetical protein MLD38_021779 [Melastoma candidum]
MARGKNRGLDFRQVVEFLSYLRAEKPLLPGLICLVILGWAIERWVFSFSNWVPLVVAVWATLQYGDYQRRILVEDLNRKWKRVILNASPVTPLEPCEWMNRLLTEIWSNFLNPKLSRRFSSLVEKRLRHKKSRLMEKVELMEFSLGSCPPSFGLQGTRWSMAGDQRILRMAFNWDTSDISILLAAKLAKPLPGTARIIINSLYIKGDLLFMPVLDGKAILFSFVSVPEVRIGIAFGSGVSQTLPVTELPGVSSWLVKLLTDTLVKTMVEPRRRCYYLPAVELKKKAVNGIILVRIVSASHLSGTNSKGISVDLVDNKDLQTFVEVELGELTRRTEVRKGMTPWWDSTFNMVLHDESGILRLHLYEFSSNNVKHNYIASCEIKVRYGADDSTIFWAIGPDSSVIASHAEFCGKEVEMVVPFEGLNSGEITVRLVLKEWQFSDGSHSVNNLTPTRSSLNGSSSIFSRTGRKLSITVIEGKDLVANDRNGRCEPYIKLHYGKDQQRTRTAHTSNPVWNHKFEFDEIGGGEYLKVKCYCQEMFGVDNIGSARVNLEGLVEGSVRDVWVPLEKVNSGEIRLRIEVFKSDEGSQGSSMGGRNGWIELVLIEAKDLVAADLRGTSDPYVRVYYGNLKRSTKVMYKTLNPRWNQTLEFPDDGSPLELHVKDHNALLPTSSIGNCIVEYQRLPPNEPFNKWIPLQGVTKGEINVRITRKVPDLPRRTSLDSEPSLTTSYKISGEMKHMATKLQSLIEEGNMEELATVAGEIERLQDVQEDYMVQLETEQMLLLTKIKELGQEILNSSPPLSRKSSNSNI